MSWCAPGHSGCTRTRPNSGRRWTSWVCCRERTRSRAQKVPKELLLEMELLADGEAGALERGLRCGSPCQSHAPEHLAETRIVPDGVPVRQVLAGGPRHRALFKAAFEPPEGS